MIKTIFIILTGLSVISALNCTNPVSDCSGRGVCYPDDRGCLCNDGVVTYPENNYPQCNYKQTVRLPAFLLHLFFGWFTGCGSFMLGENVYGIAQICLFWIGLCPLCVMVFAMWDSDNNIVLACISVCYPVIWTISTMGLWIAVLVLIGEGEFSDKNGAPLGDWV